MYQLPLLPTAQAKADPLKASALSVIEPEPTTTCPPGDPAKLIVEMAVVHVEEMEETEEMEAEAEETEETEYLETVETEVEVAVQAIPAAKQMVMTQMVDSEMALSEMAFSEMVDSEMVDSEMVDSEMLEAKAHVFLRQQVMMFEGEHSQR